jgi:hypothetical protein
MRPPGFEPGLEASFEALMREAREMRIQYVRNLLRTASVAVIGAIRLCGGIFVKKAAGESLKVSLDH